MKKLIIITLLAIIPYAIFGQNNNFILIESNVPIDSVKMPQNNIDKWDKGRRWAIGVQLGTDIGGAVPYPTKFIPSTFNPYPQLGVSVGVRGSWSYNQRWSVHFEATYKQVRMNADARVNDQRSLIDGKKQYYSGTAEMSMGFTMIELPLYAKMALSDKYNDFIILGGYYAYNLDQKFITTATSGYVGSEPGMVEGVVTPDDPMIMDFSGDLGNHDAGIIVGYERRIWDRANLGIRMMVGLKDIFMKEDKILNYKMLQMRGVVTLEYDLFLIK